MLPQGGREAAEQELEERPPLHEPRKALAHQEGKESKLQLACEWDPGREGCLSSTRRGMEEGCWVPS